jgi:hypothetical protein
VVGALYVELVRRADLPTFLGCHVRAFEALGGMPRTRLYDNTKLVVLTRDEAGPPVFTSGFLDFSDLLADLFGAEAAARRAHYLTTRTHPAHLPFQRTLTQFDFTFQSSVDRGSVILTSNKGFAEWGEVLGDPVVATAILDRLLHHSHVLNIRGESYRLREKKGAGFFGPPPTPPARPNRLAGRD